MAFVVAWHETCLPLPHALDRSAQRTTRRRQSPVQPSTRLRIAPAAPQTPVLPREVRAMRSDETSDGKDVFVESDNEQFVASAYRVILGREADFEGMDHYVRWLERGVERWEVLAALAKSGEAAARRVFWSDVSTALLSAREGGVRRSVLSEAEEATRGGSTAAAVGAESLPGSASELLELRDEQFVRTCFMTLLRRPADPTGIGNYLRQVRAGVSKSKIVAELVSSPEGRKIEHTLPGLASLVEAERRARPNLLQRLLRRLGRDLFYPVEVQLNALENRLYSRMTSAGDAAERRPSRARPAAKRRRRRKSVPELPPRARTWRGSRPRSPPRWLRPRPARSLREPGQCCVDSWPLPTWKATDADRDRHAGVANQLIRAPRRGPVHGKPDPGSASAEDAA